MARATTGGRSPVGGRRRSCRRLLPALLVLAALLPSPVSAASDTDAWMLARQVHTAQSVAIGDATKELADGADEAEVEELRQTVASAVQAMDLLDVRDCFRVWWSYVRTSYVLFDQALIGLEASDPGRVQAATASSLFLTSMAASTAVDCTLPGSALSTRPRLPPSGGHPMVVAPGTL